MKEKGAAKLERLEPNFINEFNMHVKQLQQQLEKKQNTLCSTSNKIIDILTLTVKMMDLYTFKHQQRVAKLASRIAKELNICPKDIERIKLAASIHDIGKLNIPITILNKPDKLTDDEFKVIKKHPKAGYDIINNVKFPWPIAELILQHHERLNGSGYPKGLQEGEILIGAKIIAVADVVEAMVSHRPYKPSLKLDRALKEVIEYKGILYDTKVVNACLKIFRQKGFDFS